VAVKEIPKSLLVVRHSRSVFNEANFNRNAGLPYSKELLEEHDDMAAGICSDGEVQARITSRYIGELITSIETDFTLGLTSTFPRTLQTRDMLLLPHTIEWQERNELREFDGGHRGEPREPWERVFKRVGRVVERDLSATPEGAGAIIISHRGTMNVLRAYIQGLKTEEDFEDVRKPEERKNAANCEIHQYETTEAGIFFRSHRAWRGNPGSVEERPVETIASEWLLIAPTMNQH